MIKRLGKIRGDLFGPIFEGYEKPDMIGLNEPRIWIQRPENTLLQLVKLLEALF